MQQKFLVSGWMSMSRSNLTRNSVVSGNGIDHLRELADYSLEQAEEMDFKVLLRTWSGRVPEPIKRKLLLEIIKSCSEFETEIMHSFRQHMRNFDSLPHSAIADFFETEDRFNEDLTLNQTVRNAFEQMLVFSVPGRTDSN